MTGPANLTLKIMSKRLKCAITLEILSDGRVRVRVVGSEVNVEQAVKEIGVLASPVRLLAGVQISETTWKRFVYERCNDPLFVQAHDRYFHKSVFFFSPFTLVQHHGHDGRSSPSCAANCRWTAPTADGVWAWCGRVGATSSAGRIIL